MYLSPLPRAVLLTLLPKVVTVVLAGRHEKACLLRTLGESHIRQLSKKYTTIEIWWKLSLTIRIDITVQIEQNLYFIADII